MPRYTVHPSQSFEFIGGKRRLKQDAPPPRVFDVDVGGTLQLPLGAGQFIVEKSEEENEFTFEHVTYRFPDVRNAVIDFQAAYPPETPISVAAPADGSAAEYAATLGTLTSGAGGVEVREPPKMKLSVIPDGEEVSVEREIDRPLVAGDEIVGIPPVTFQYLEDTDTATVLQFAFFVGGVAQPIGDRYIVPDGVVGDLEYGAINAAPGQVIKSATATLDAAIEGEISADAAYQYRSNFSNNVISFNSEDLTKTENGDTIIAVVTAGRETETVFLEDADPANNVVFPKVRFVEKTFSGTQSTLFIGQMPRAGRIDEKVVIQYSNGEVSPFTLINVAYVRGGGAVFASQSVSHSDGADAVQSFTFENVPAGSVAVLLAAGGVGSFDEEGYSVDAPLSIIPGTDQPVRDATQTEMLIARSAPLTGGTETFTFRTTGSRAGSHVVIIQPA